MSMIEVLSPFDGSKVGEVGLSSAHDVENMLSTAHATHLDVAGRLQPYERIAILDKLAKLVEQASEEFALLIAREGGKPLMDAKVEVARAIDGIKLAAKELSHVVCGSEIPMGLTAASQNRKAFTSYEPIGVVVAVSAFNHPLNLIVHQVIPAIAVGCPVIVKPAMTTPLNCAKLVELLYEAGLDAKWCKLCVCDNDVAEKLVTDKRLGFFSFIGSTGVGWMLRSKLAPGVRCALEHGGAAPVIVGEDVDIDKIVPSLAKGAFYHAGQVCVSVQRVFVHSKIAHSLAKKLAQAASKMVVGDATDPKTEVGPLILEREVDRVESWVNEALDVGAESLCGAKKLSDSTYAPTVLYDPPADAKVSTSEIFGPVVCVYPFDDVDVAIKQANSLDVAFQSAVYSSDMEFVTHVAKHLDATAVMVNDHTAFRVDWMPFAGRRHSGLGVGGIGHTMHDMVVPKMLVMPW